MPDHDLTKPRPHNSHDQGREYCGTDSLSVIRNFQGESEHEITRHEALDHPFGSQDER